MNMIYTNLRESKSIQINNLEMLPNTFPLIDKFLASALILAAKTIGRSP